MKTPELIELLKTLDVTDETAYNLIVSDLYDAVPQEQVEHGQRLVAYFMYKIQHVCLPVIRDLQQTKEV